MTNFTFNLPKLSTDKKPVFKQKELDSLMNMQLSERTPVLELINPYLQALNRYKMPADKRLALVEKILPHCFTSIQIIRQQYLHASIPENFNQRTAINIALETTRQLIFTFKHSLSEEADSLTANRKLIALYAFRILELLSVQQSLHALRYQKLSGTAWEEMHAIFFALQPTEEAQTPQTSLADLYTPKGSSTPDMGYSIQHYYTLLQLFEFLDIQSWSGEHQYLAERYIFRDPPLEWSTLPTHPNTTLVTYPGLNSSADKFQDNLPAQVLYLDLKPLIQRLQNDQHLLKMLDDQAPSSRRPVTTSRLMPSLALFLINRLLTRLLEPRKEARDFLIGTASAEVYSGWSECAQQLNPQSNSEFERFIPNSSAIEDWQIIEDTPNTIRLRTRENKTTPDLAIGLLICYKPSVPPHNKQLAWIERILKITDREIEISLRKLPAKSETVTIRPANPDLNDKQWLITAILCEDHQQDLLLLDHGVTIPADKELVLHRYHDKVPFTLKQRYQTWRSHEIYSVTLDLDAAYNIVSALAEPAFAPKEYLSIPKGLEEFSLTLPADHDDEQEFTLDTTLPSTLQAIAIIPQWTAHEIVADRYRILSLLTETGQYKRYHAHHLNWDVDILLAQLTPDPLLAHTLDTLCQISVHPHCLNTYYYWQPDPRADFILVSEYPHGQPLHKHLHYNFHPSAELALDLAIQLAWGLQHLHQQKVGHPDLRPETLWIATHATSLLARISPPLAYPNATATLDYAAPEQAATPSPLTDPQWPAANRYSWALIVWRLWGGTTVWTAQTPPTAAQLQTQTTFALPDSLKSLLQACWNPNPLQRPDWTTILQQLMAIYTEISQTDYPRPLPQVAREDYQNNQALAALDQNRPAEAKRLWLDNLSHQADHTASAYNLALWQWRQAEITDEDILAVLQQLQANATHWLYDYLQGCVHLERGDFKRALELLESSLNLPQVKNALAYAADHQAQTRGCQQQTPAPSPLSAIDLNPRNQRVLSGHQDGQVRVWQLQPWHLQQTLPLHDLPITTVSLSLDEQLGLSADAQQLHIWSVHTGQILQTFHQAGISTARFSLDHQWVAAGGRDKIIRIWNLQTGQLRFNLSEHRGAIHALQWHADHRQLITASEDCTLKLWDITTGRCLQTLRGHSAPVLSVVFLSKQQQILSASGDGSIRRWQLPAATCIHQYHGHHAAVTSLSISPDAQFILSASQDATVRLWDLPQGRCLHTFYTERPQHHIRFTENGEQALSMDSEHFHHWQMDTGEQQTWHAPLLVAPVPPHDFYVSAVDQFERATQKAQASIEKRLYRKTFQLLQLARQQPFYEKDPEALALWTELYSHLPRITLQDSWQYHHFKLQSSWVKCAKISHKAQYLLAGNQAGLLQMWELVTEQHRCLKTFTAHQGAIHSLDISPDDQWAITGGEDRQLRYWNLAQAEAQHTLTGHEAPITQVAFLREGQYALSASQDQTVRLWDLAQGRCLHSYQGHHSQINSLAISPDEQFFLTASGSPLGTHDNSLKLWNLVTGECVRTFEGHEAPVNIACFSPDGQTAFSASDDKTIRQWHLYRGQCQKVIKLHASEVRTLDISPDGCYAVSGDNACNLYLWDTQNTQLLQSFSGHHKPLQVTRLSRDNQYLLSADRSEQIVLWFLDWQLQMPASTAWDWKIMPWLIAFFNRHTPRIQTEQPPGTAQALQQQGEAEWTMQHFEHLCQQLGHAGYGWLEPKTLWQQLNTIGEYWPKEPLPLFEPTETCTHCQAEYQPPPVCLNCGQPIARANPQAILQQVHTTLEKRQYATALEIAQVLHEQSDYRYTPLSIRVWGDLYRHFIRSCFNDAWKGVALKIPQSNGVITRLSHHHQYLLAGTQSGQILAWELLTQEYRCIQTINSHQGQLTALAISFENQWLASAGSTNTDIKLWELRTGQLQQTLHGHTEKITQLLFLRRPGWLISASEDMTIKLWNIHTGACVKTLSGHHNKINALAISQDDRYLLSGAGDDLGYRDNSLKLWDLSTADCLRTFIGHDMPVTTVSLSANGQFAYSGGRDGLIHQWSVYTGALLKTMSDHQNTITEIRLSPDGAYLLSGSHDNSARLWEIDSGDCIFHFTGHTHRVHSIDMSTDLRYAVTAGDSRFIQLWHLDWDIELPTEAWTWQVMPWVAAFLNRHLILDNTLSISHPPPQWDSTAFKQLYTELGYAGYGWVEPKRLWHYLEQLTPNWQKPQCLLDMPVTCHHCDAEHQFPPHCLSCEHPLEIEAIQCPECGYERQITDTSPNWQCPRCGLDYAG